MTAEPYKVVKTAKIGSRGSFDYVFAGFDDAIWRLFRLEQFLGSFFRGSADRVDCVALDFLTNWAGSAGGISSESWRVESRRFADAHRHVIAGPPDALRTRFRPRLH